MEDLEEQEIVEEQPKQQQSQPQPKGQISISEGFLPLLMALVGFLMIVIYAFICLFSEFGIVDNAIRIIFFVLMVVPTAFGLFLSYKQNKDPLTLNMLANAFVLGLSFIVLF